MKILSVVEAFGPVLPRAAKVWVREAGNECRSIYVCMYVCYICTDIYILSYNGGNPQPDGVMYSYVVKLLLP